MLNASVNFMLDKIQNNKITMKNKMGLSCAKLSSSRRRNAQGGRRNAHIIISESIIKHTRGGRRNAQLGGGHGT